MGQRKAFLIGTIIGVLAGMLSFYAILKNSFVLFVLGNTLIGVCQAFTQYYRFAAADSVPQKIKGKAISFVIGGGVVAAIAGPALARSTQNIGAVSFAYSFLSISFLSIISFLVNFGLKEKKRITAQQKDFQFKQSRPLGEIMGQNKTILALLSSAVGYSVMIMIMTATPLAMHHCGYSGDDSSVVIQWHVLGMFVPSFFTGTLIEKFGTGRIILSGVGILFLHLYLVLTGTDFLHFVSGLIFLGIGWNFMFVGGSTLLSKVYREDEKEKVQAFHDFFVYIIMSISSLSAGVLLSRWGWKGVNIAAIPMLLIVLGAFAIMKAKHKKRKKSGWFLTPRKRIISNK
ncbi:MFS transporter [Flavobacterium johnsoniae]|uniref:MFS transporter n=1 Tax=Flavobacterium johnsoniae TaxID=986 RepID=UPI0025B0E2B2|nr:MFS transporter [Flavobacterium johnsoniae]WJS93484.1 MFS transporter [Flavobacterium johnsoniae]